MNENFQAKRLLSYLFIFGIAVLFALQWGPAARGCEAPLAQQTDEVAATVNGKDILLKDFNRAYEAQLSYMSRQGSPIPADLAKQLGLPKQVLDMLVEEELKAQAAEKQGIAASDTELSALIRKNPDFHRDGKFNPSQYREVLRDYFRKTDVSYEADLRRRLAAIKLTSIVEGGAVVSDDEVKARFLKEGNKAQVTFVRFLPAMYAAKVATAKPAELEAFKKDHAKEISDYYEANKRLYEQPERVKARHILIKVEADAPGAKRDEAKAKIENLKKELEGGKDFAETAKQFSEDPGSKDKGGDLGFNERSAWTPTFADAAFKLNAGELSAPVETPFGWHLIKVEEKKAPEKKALTEVEADIAKQLYSKEKAKALARAEAEKALTAARAGKKLVELFPAPKEEPAQKNPLRFEVEEKPQATDTGEFNSTTDSLPQLGPAPELVKAVFALESPKLLDRVYAVDEGFVVASVTERKRPTDTDFTAQKDTLKNEAIKGKQYELRDSFLKALKKQATIVTNEKALGTAVTNAEG